MNYNYYFKSAFFFFFFIAGALHADPFGKDADLCDFNYRKSSCESSNKCITPFLGLIGERLIRFHQEVISPADGPRSHFIPSSSQYTLDAMRKYGFFQGFSMGCDRLMRENKEPWVYPVILDGAGKAMKYNPVP